MFRLALFAVLMFGYLIVVGAEPVLLRLIGGGDSTDLLVAREQILKLNPDKVQVRMISMLRDMIGPVLLILSVGLLRARQLRPLAGLATITVSVVALTWSGQKSPIMAAQLAALIWETHHLQALIRALLRWSAPIMTAVLGVWIASQPDLLQTSANLGDYASRLLSGLNERIFITPFEVTATHLFAAERGEISWRGVIPSYAFIWQPTSEGADAYIGRTYFSGGYDSTLSGALCFGYSFVIGSLPFCFLLGFSVMPFLSLSVKMVGVSCSTMIQICYAAYLTVLIVDGAHGNLLQYLVNNLFLAALLCASGALFATVRASRLRRENRSTFRDTPRPSLDYSGTS
jgi:hypothetical protein